MASLLSVLPTLLQIRRGRSITYLPAEWCHIEYATEPCLATVEVVLCACLSCGVQQGDSEQVVHIPLSAVAQATVSGGLEAAIAMLKHGAIVAMGDRVQTKRPLDDYHNPDRRPRNVLWPLRPMNPVVSFARSSAIWRSRVPIHGLRDFRVLGRDSSEGHKQRSPQLAIKRATRTRPETGKSMYTTWYLVALGLVAA
ncbi:uncharacterized protein BDZ99DRAFT_524863 [Mytilinidion resinicola]|uniref:Uncharacterized protein n=1 Tax=Mytilinidion resinicola TaxID=574789 RepID=A0A6A6Y9B0_9PEZI|nr:uncharacterized protein BDZ99DRAFT_524863 [Mytilinidion resinicola]KAF2805148.1 hypothetical protein BDZ99DRAFT_524863 [Mytilinidion resinicola]